MSTNRRNFIKTASLGSLLAANWPAIDIPSSKRITLSKDDVILFQGDSITDFHRKRDDNNPNSPAALGTGYPFLAAADLLYRDPEKNLRIYNKGVSGNKVYQLAERWQTDCLDLKPTVLSILVGVNDFWHTLVNGYTGTIKTYRDDFKTLLDRTKQQLPDVKLIIGEPYAVIGVKAVDDKWYPAFNDYRQAAREIAENFNAAFIPYQEIYDKAQKSAPGSYWTADGVHPTLAGARLMAAGWLQTVKG
ncbi:MAG TPA: SGNH/GDSL hydrolase family protein [Puia sp.]|jgi:lysophospholipase L1-like esterase